MIRSEKSFQASLLLLITAVIWGGGFVAQRLAMQQLGPFLFNGFRFSLGALTLAPVLLLRKRQARTVPVAWQKTIPVGVTAGLFLFFGATFQQLGLVYTTAGKAGFITGLYVIIVPILGMFWGDRAPLGTWVGALLAVGGLYFLSVSPGFQIAPGDGYELLGAFFWAGHVQWIAKYSPRMDPFQISFVQAIFTSLLSFGTGFLLETYDPAALMSAFWLIVYGGVVSIGIAYTMQVIGQQVAKPTPAAILLSMESVFAAFLGWFFLREALTPRVLAGCGLMLAGMILSQSWDGKARHEG